MNIEDLAFLQEHVSIIDGQRPERLDEVRDRIRAARRRRAAAVIGGAAAAVLVGAIALIANPSPHARVEPAGQEVLAPDPFLTDREASVWAPRVRLVNVTPPRLDPCLPRPTHMGCGQDTGSDLPRPSLQPNRCRLQDERVPAATRRYVECTPSLSRRVPAGQGLRSW